MKYTLIITIVALLLIGGFIFFNKTTDGNSGDDLPSSQDVQRLTLSMNGNYSPNTIKVKANQPVEITLDNSIRGCYRSFNIPVLGVSYRSLDPSDTIKFTPNQKGTFRFQCSMGMGTGNIIVE